MCHASPLHSLPFSFIPLWKFFILSLFISYYIPNIITTFVASFLVFFFLPRIFNAVIEQQKRKKKKITLKKIHEKKKTFETQTHKVSFAYFGNKERRERKTSRKFGQGMEYYRKFCSFWCLNESWMIRNLETSAGKLF